MNSVPWTMKIELTEGCNRMCKFCAINAIRKAPGNYKFASVDTISLIAEDVKQFAPNAKWEMSMRGEPLLNPNVVDILMAIRHELPKTQLLMSTNGMILRKNGTERLRGVFDTGLDILIVDTYYPERDEIRAIVSEAASGNMKVLDYFQDCAPRGWSPYTNHHRKDTKIILFMDDIFVSHDMRRYLYNQAGNVRHDVIPPLSSPLDKMCVRPFRELAIHYDGTCVLCCNDYGREFVVGDVNRKSLRDVWIGKELTAARRALFSRCRGFSPCARCDSKPGSRVGWVQKQEPFDDKDLKVVEKVLRKSPRINGFAVVVTGKLRRLVGNP